MDLIPNKKLLTPPGGESEEHFYLKQIGKIYLKVNYGCKYIGSEVYLGYSNDYSIKQKYSDLPFNKKKITDIVGIQDKKLKYMSHKGIIRNVEVKISKSDYYNGYCVMGDYNYLMTPAGLLDKNKIPKMIGLIEVDLDKVKLEKAYGNFIIKGLELVKYPTRIKYKNYIKGSHKRYLQWVKKNMLVRHTNRDIYHNMWFYI